MDQDFAWGGFGSESEEEEEEEIEREPKLQVNNLGICIKAMRYYKKTRFPIIALMYYQLISKTLTEEEKELAREELNNIVEIYIDSLTLKALENKDPHKFFSDSLSEIQTLSKITDVPREQCRKLFTKRILKYNKLHLTIALYQALKKPELIQEALQENIKAF